MESHDIEISVLFNDIPGDPRLETAHGIACLIEGKEQTILFDTGGDGHMLLDNMHKLGKDPERVDIVIVSHQHWDHSGGLFTLLRATGPVRAFLPKAFVKDFVSHGARLGAQVTIVDGPIEIIPGVYSTGQMGDDNLPRERREQSLVLDTTAGTAVLTGCAHPGIVEIVERAKEIRPGDIDIALGGFHLKESDESRVSAVIKALKDLGVMRMGCSHCTGGPQTEMFQKAWQNDFVPFGCGTSIRLQSRQ